MTKKPTGYIIWRGRSLLDGEDIMVVALSKSTNGKTGNMIQTYIMRADMNPMEASKIGADFSICGHCPHRGIAVPDDPDAKQAKERPCYVLLFQGPLNVWKSFEKGNYPMISGHDALAELGSGADIRLGTYGDPAVVPSYVWDSLLSECNSTTGYSHQAFMEKADYRPEYMMRSVDTLDDAKLAWSLGERTFRVASLDTMVKGKEVLCPASEEAGRKTTCVSCRLCGGMKVNAKSILIPAHGNGKKYAYA